MSGGVHGRARAAAGADQRGGAGTLFLDELDTLTPRAQVALLRFLQDRRYRALGSTVEQRADVRFVAATNARLEGLKCGRGRSGRTSTTGYRCLR